jgi:hypothetical protein
VLDDLALSSPERLHAIGREPVLGDKHLRSDAEDEAVSNPVGAKAHRLIHLIEQHEWIDLRVQELRVSAAGADLILRRPREESRRLDSVPDEHPVHSGRRARFAVSRRGRWALQVAAELLEITGFRGAG